jgi:hypothetical protein
MDSLNPKSVGRIVEDGVDTASIINSSGVQFKLGKNAVWVWKTCNGTKTRYNLMRGYAKEFNLRQGDVEPAVDAILNNLERISLIRLGGGASL